MVVKIFVFDCFNGSKGQELLPNKQRPLACAFAWPPFGRQSTIGANTVFRHMGKPSNSEVRSFLTMFDTLILTEMQSLVWCAVGRDRLEEKIYINFSIQISFDTCIAL